MIDEQKGNDSVITRYIEVYYLKEEPFVVRQVHYQGWPDHGVPTKTKADFEDVLNIFTDFLRKRADEKVLVHCSAGIGRTGTSITLA